MNNESIIPKRRTYIIMERESGPHDTLYVMERIFQENVFSIPKDVPSGFGELMGITGPQSPLDAARLFVLSIAEQSVDIDVDIDVDVDRVPAFVHNGHNVYTFRFRIHRGWDEKHV